MTPIVTINDTCSDNATAVAPTAAKPDMSYLPAYNVAGGRPTERFGTRGSFTPGVRIMSGGPAREVPVEAETVDHGKVLFVSSTLKPDMSYLPAYNAAGGRPTERFGTRGSFTPGVRIMSGGPAREVPVEAETVNHGEVLFVSSTLKPDMSYLPAYNVAGGRPTERFGTRGSFTPGVRILSGGAAREVPLEAETVDHGEVLFVSSTLKPNMSYLPAYNVAGGRPMERFGTRGSFTPGVRILSGGAAREVPLEAETVNHGEVLFVSSTLKPDLSGEARTNLAGGRPTERLGSRGRFTPGARRWLGGEPRDVPAELDFTSRGVVLLPRVAQLERSSVADCDVGITASSDKDVGDGGDAWFFETEDITMEESFQANDAALVARIISASSSFNDLAKEGGGAGAVFGRCGSDSKFNAGAALLNNSPCRPSF